MLFALCLNPLIHRLEQLNGICVHPQQRVPAVVAYVDDVTILVTAPEEVEASPSDGRVGRHEEGVGHTVQ